mmetsp:Transcript_25601/g.36079  ORF Transcript_25601/g.36079 Transcript_25601/m.36079 type:complete len:215 (-) Transcript_25601:242-886(-)
MDPPECSGHSHDHDHGDELGLSLRPQVDFPKVMCLNEEVTNSGQRIIKIHEERLTTEPSLTSPEDDAELLLHVPFTESVTIQSISIRSTRESDNTFAPKTVKLFVDRENLDFETARELPPAATLELVPPDHFVEGSIDYPLRPAGRFQNVSAVSIFFAENYSGDEETSTEVTFVGFKGKGTNVKRMAVEAVYETSANLEDHEVHTEGIGAPEGL